MTTQFDPEDDSGGNIEYKEYFSPRITDARIEHLMTQMKWRMSEGNGECIYFIGVADNGSVTGLNDMQYSHAVTVMNRIITSLGFRVHELLSVPIPANNEKRYIQFTIHSRTAVCNPEKSVNVCFIGQHASGKSTLVASMYSGKLDDGQGKIRHITHSHRHEILNGCTSSISETHIKNLTLYDLPGKKRYLQTMIRGLLVYRPDVLVITEASDTFDPDHIRIADFLGIPRLLVKTKADLPDPQEPPETLSWTPDFSVSAVTGQSVNELKEHLFKTPSFPVVPVPLVGTYIEIVKLYSIKGIGYVIYGMVICGTINVSDILSIGPFSIGGSYRFCPVILRSIHYRGRNVSGVSGNTGAVSVGLLVEFGSRQDSIIYCLKKRRGDIMTSNTSVPLVRSLRLIPVSGNPPKKGSVYTLMYRNVKVLARVTGNEDVVFKVNLKSATVSPFPLTDKCALISGSSLILATILPKKKTLPS